MTVANQTNRVSAVGTNSVGQTIPFSFPITSASDLAVYRRITATGAETTLVLTTNYTVAITGDTGGTVTTVTAVAVTAEIHIIRDTPNTQTLDLTTGGTFNAENVEDALDKGVKLGIENKDVLTRTMRIAQTDGTSINMELPSSVDRVGKFLTFDANGEPAVTEEKTIGNVNFSAYGETIVDDANAAAARATLEAYGEGDTIIPDSLVTRDPWLDVRHPDFGAIGDGVADDTVAIQAAIAAAMAAGLTLYFPNGTYDCATWATGYSVTSPLYIRGESRAGAIIQGPDNTVDFISTIASVFVEDVTFTQWDDVILVGTLTADFEMRLNNVKNTNSNALVYRHDALAYNLENFSMTNCLVDHSARSGNTTAGLRLRGQMINANVSNNVFTDIGGYAVDLGGDVSTATWDTKQRFVVADNIFKNIIAVGSGVATTEEAHAAMVMGRFVSITGNVVDTVKSLVDGDNAEAFYTKAAYGVISNNAIYNGGTGDAAIDIKGTPRGEGSTSEGYAFIVANNQIAWPDDATKENATAGIYCKASDTLITGNIIEYSIEYGIYLDITALKNIAITNNTIYNNRGNTAINIQGGGNNLTVSNNRILGMIGDLAALTEVHGIYIDAQEAAISYVDVHNNIIQAGNECVAASAIGAIHFREQGFAMDYVTCINNVVRIAHDTLTEHGIRHTGVQASTNYVYHGNDVSQMAANPYTDEAVTAYDWKTFSNIVAGTDGTNRGTLTLWDGAGGNTPGYVKIHSPNGTAWYLFVEDDGTLKIHNGIPSANADGDAVGDQTD